jgi:hypothetical protein
MGFWSRFFEQTEDGSAVDMVLLEKQARILFTDKLLTEGRIKNYSERGDTLQAKRFRKRLGEIEHRLTRIERQLSDLKAAEDEVEVWRRVR